jgi:MoaA/NifB/PqqE/SkfB family radical SAM enzyme
MNFGHISSIMNYLAGNLKSSKPLRATLAYTSECNLKCNMCNVWVRSDEVKSELSLEEWKKVADILATEGVRLIFLFGGEPFLRSDIYEFIEYCKIKHNLFVETVSNGTCFNEKNAKKVVKSGIDKLCISLDGPSKIHDKIRGIPGSYAKSLEGISNIIAARGSLGSKTPYLEIENTVQVANYQHIESLLDEVKDLGVEEMRIRHMGFFPPDELKQYDNIMGTNQYDEKPIFSSSSGDSYLLTPEKIIEFRNELARIKGKGRKYGIRLNIDPTFYTVKDYLQGREVKTCLHLWTQVFVDPWGRLNPCGWYDKHFLGNILEEPFENLWNSEVYKKLRKNISLLKACSKCCYFNITLKDNVKVALSKHRNMLASLLAK